MVFHQKSWKLEQLNFRVCSLFFLTHVSIIENGQVNGNEVNGFRLLKKMTLKQLTITDLSNNSSAMCR